MYLLLPEVERRFIFLIMTKLKYMPLLVSYMNFMLESKILITAPFSRKGQLSFYRVLDDLKIKEIFKMKRPLFCFLFSLTRHW